MRNFKDQRTKIFPSTTRGGKELPSSSALDSPSVLSKHATPKPASAMHDTYDETTSMLDNIVPLGEFLDEQLARARENEIIETDNTDEVMMKILPLDMNCMLFLRVMLWMRKLLELFLLAKIDMILRSY